MFFRAATGRSSGRMRPRERVSRRIWAPDLEEAQVVHEVLGRLLEADGKLEIGGFQRGMMRNLHTWLGARLERGEITEAERGTLVRLAQLLSVLGF